MVHTALTFGDGDLLMGSDDPTGDGSGMKGAAINLTLDDPAEARRIFEALAEDGSIDMALGETFAMWLQGRDDLITRYVGGGIGCEGSRLLLLGTPNTSPRRWALRAPPGAHR